MGFLDRPVQKSTNPTSRFLEWKSEDKQLAFWSKEAQQNELVPLPFKFLVLEEYHTIKGFSDSDNIGIYANEVLTIGSQELEVKTFKGRVIAKGLYKNIKQVVDQAGGRYHKSIYGVTPEGELINIQLKGSSIAKWSEFTQKGAWKRLKDEWVVIDSAEELQKGRVKYSVPNFKFDKSLTNEEFEMVKEKAVVFEEYINGYLNKEEAEKEEEREEVSNLDDLDF